MAGRHEFLFFTKRHARQILPQGGLALFMTGVM